MVSLSPLAIALNNIRLTFDFSTYIYFIDNVRAGYSAIEVYLGGVPADELDGMYTKLVDALKKVAKEGIDMSRMSTIITRDKLRVSRCSDCLSLKC